jgi:hypothetical protein
MTTSRSEDTNRTIQFSGRVACPKHGAVMVLVRHVLGSKFLDGHPHHGVVTFFRCTGTDDGVQCKFMRPNKYQVRKKGERHK